MNVSEVSAEEGRRSGERSLEEVGSEPSLKQRSEVDWRRGGGGGRRDFWWEAGRNASSFGGGN